MHKAYYARATIHNPFSAPWSTDMDLRVSKFCQTLRRCKRRSVRLSLDIDIEWDRGRWLWDLGIRRHHSWLDDEPLCDLFVERILPALADVLPLVFKLRIRAYPGYPEAIYGALRGAAPLLEYLELDLSDEYNGYEAEAPPPPHDLLASNAPRLRVLRLADIELPSTPIHAFQHVDDVHVEFVSQPALSHIMACLPRPTCLRISGGKYNPDPGAYAVTASFGPRIRTLVLSLAIYEDYPEDICNALKLQRIQHVQLDFSSGALDIFPFLDYLPEYLSLAVQPDRDGFAGLGRIEFAPADPLSDACTRAFVFSDLDFKRPFLRTQLSLLSHRLVRVEMLHKYLTKFVYAMRSLPELTVLAVDITHTLWRPRWYQCQLGRAVPIFPDRSTTLDEESTFELMHLARDLSLLRPNREPSATLSLEGVTLSGPWYTGLCYSLRVMFLVLIRFYCQCPMVINALSMRAALVHQTCCTGHWLSHHIRRRVGEGTCPDESSGQPPNFTA
ncbi:hypothetical protein AURDEDRAFT_129947 [Auricularia subglabra TFB-10046 SS5]|nr:hypothetical protein AURDEDRAFT_129947 [Auricularia subglabra TFB-10046 SS5]